MLVPSMPTDYFLVRRRMKSWLNDAPRVGVVLGELNLVLRDDLCVLVEHDEPRRAVRLSRASTGRLPFISTR